MSHKYMVSLLYAKPRLQRRDSLKQALANETAKPAGNLQACNELLSLVLRADL